MAFIELTRDAFENVSVSLRPKIHFISSSIGEGVTGSEYVSPVRSKCIRNVEPHSDHAELGPLADVLSPHGFITATAELAVSASASGETDISDFLDLYLEKIVPGAERNIRFTKTLDIFRFDPSFKFEPPGGLNLTIKNNVRNILMDHHKSSYQDCGFYYRNYNTVNFFTASQLPDEAVLMYPDSSNKYIPKGPFAVTFWINPRYQNDEFQHYKAGTVLHVSSSFCVSLISGSVDHLGKADRFKIMLQLSHSADIPPSKVNFSNLAHPSDLIFTSSHYLSKNNWHHVGIAWGGDIADSHTGSINIDSRKTRFVVPSSSISTKTHNADGSAIFVGNYYDGASSHISKFFNKTVATNEGLEQLDPTPSTSDPLTSVYDFNHMLNAEFHELKIHAAFLSTSTLEINKTDGANSTDGLLFYLPPYFYPETKKRNIIQTPFQTYHTSSNDPFNVAFSFGVGGKEINTENFVRDFVSKQNPRLFHMTASTIDTTIQNISADDYVYATDKYSSGSILRRNFLILPNDNGLFSPNYTIIETQATGSLTASYITSNEGIDYGIIKLEDLIPESSLFPGLIHQTGSILDEIMGSSPENPGVVPGSVLTIAQRTRDTSSNEIVIYNISNLYYGNRVHPTSFEIIESNLTGSGGKLKFNIKDNGRGLLYRADAETAHAEWAGIGNIFYDEGVAIIKTPHIPYINKDKTELKFRGEHNIHSLTINVPVARHILNTSSNPNFVTLPPSTNISDSDLEALKLTSVNVHDENFNIIMKANFAQPIIKTIEDEFVVRLKEDF